MTQPFIPPELGYELYGREIEIWNGTVLDPETCQRYRTMWTNRARVAGGRPTTNNLVTISNEPCKFRDENNLTASECLTLGLNPTFLWAECHHPLTPQGKYVCPCKGCNSGCLGYQRANSVLSSNICTLPRISSHLPHPTLGRCAVINLPRRQDRLLSFSQRRTEKGWGLAEPEIITAIDGELEVVPSYYKAGGGAYGCRESHLGILRSMRDSIGSVTGDYESTPDDIPPVTVLEDDLDWRKDTWTRLATFLEHVPSDWDMLMLGGQHRKKPVRINEHVLQCVDTHRTHAYCIRGQALVDLINLWEACDFHIDHWMGPWMSRDNRKVYAPRKFLFGQNGGRSDIAGRVKYSEFWNEPEDTQPIVYVDPSVPSSIVDSLREEGLLHTGYDRVGPYDRGLIDLVQRGDLSASSLRKWLDTLRWESASREDCLVGVYHPDIPVSYIQRCYPTGPVHTVSGDQFSIRIELEDILQSSK